MRNLEKKAPLETMLSEDNVAGGITFVALDLNDPASIEAAVADVLAQTGGRLDAVVHNAGVAIAGAHEDLPDAEIRRVMETNFFGVLGLTRALLPTFREQKHGRIVCISSQAAFAGQPTNSIYCASKWALEGLTRSMAIELGPKGIRVNTICPTFIETPLTRPFLSEPAFRDSVLSKIKLGRLGTVEELMGAAVFLASDASALMTGSSLSVDGGWTAE